MWRYRLPQDSTSYGGVSKKLEILDKLGGKLEKKKP